MKRAVPYSLALSLLLAGTMAADAQVSGSSSGGSGSSGASSSTSGVGASSRGSRSTSPAGTIRAPGSQPSAKSGTPSTPEATAPTAGGQDASRSDSGLRRSFTPPASTSQQPAPGTPNSTGAAGASPTQNPAAQPRSAAGTPAGGAAQSKSGLHPAQGDPEPPPAQQDENEQEQRAGSGLPGGGSAGEAPQKGDSKAGGSVLSLSSEEIEKIRRVISSYSIAPPERAKFQMRVGALVPDNVNLRPIPPELKGVIPDHQNFSYIRTPGRIAIVITDKREIDLLIPA